MGLRSIERREYATNLVYHEAPERRDFGVHKPSVSNVGLFFGLTVMSGLPLCLILCGPPPKTGGWLQPEAGKDHRIL